MLGGQGTAPPKSLGSPEIEVDSMSYAPQRSSSFAAVAAMTTVALASAALIGAPAHAAEELDVIDTGTLSSLRGLDITPDGSLLFVTDQNSDEVAVIDAITHANVTTIAVGDEPTNVTVNPAGTLAYVINSADNSISVIDISALAVVGGQIPVSNFPSDVTFAPDGLTAYVAGYGAGEIKVIDVASATVVDTISGLNEPQAVRVTPDGSTLWVSGGSSVRSVNLSTFALGTPIQSSPVSQIRYFDLSPDGSLIAAGGDGSQKVFLIDTATSTIVDEIDAGQNAYGFAFNADGTRLFVGRGDNGVLEIDPATGDILKTITTGTEPWSVVTSPSGDFGYAANNEGAVVTVFGDPVRRTAGASRYETAVKASQQAYPAGSQVLFIATGTNYPDALSAGPAAANVDAPLLLTEPGALPGVVLAEINRLDPDRIIVVGGEGAVSASVFAALQPLAPTVERISGVDRYDTSRKVTEEAFGPGGASDVYIATGRNFPDALSAGAVGASFGRPVLLVDGAATSVTQDTLDTMTYLGVANVLVAGGVGAVSQAIEDQLSLAPVSLNVDRLAGTSRYDTSLTINQDGFPTSAVRVLIATGLNFPDALAGSAWAGRIQAPLFIVPGTCIPQNILDEITNLGALQVTLIGGTSVVTQSVFDLTAC
jgi:YVTN family beta-propeller protein